MPALENKAKWANEVRRVNRRTNALPDQPTNQPTNRRTQTVIEVLARKDRRRKRNGYSEKDNKLKVKAKKILSIMGKGDERGF